MSSWRMPWCAACMSDAWPADEIEYLEETLREYARFVEHIGENGLAANLLLYYRDELQETLEDLQGRVPVEPYWRQTVDLDHVVREKGADLVAEIGWDHYRGQRAVRHPPRAYWWWYLDAGLSAPDRPNPVRSWWDWLRKP